MKVKVEMNFMLVLLPCMISGKLRCENLRPGLSCTRNLDQTRIFIKHLDIERLLTRLKTVQKTLLFTNEITL